MSIYKNRQHRLAEYGAFIGKRKGEGRTLGVVMTMTTRAETSEQASQIVLTHKGIANGYKTLLVLTPEDAVQLGVMLICQAREAREPTSD